MRIAVVLSLLAAAAGCGLFTDAATRIAYDLESNLHHLAPAEGATHVIRHATPSKAGECTGPFTVQFDKAGALVIWCKDAGGNTLTSHITSYHRSFIDTERTWIVDKPAGSTLLIHLQRKQGRAVITEVR